MAKALKLQEFKEIVQTLKERRQAKSLEEKFGWYQRYWSKCYVDPNGEKKELMPE